MFADCSKICINVIVKHKQYNIETIWSFCLSRGIYFSVLGGEKISGLWFARGNQHPGLHHMLLWIIPPYGKLFILWDNKNNIRNFQEKSKENRKIVRYGLETTLSLIWKVETILITVMWHQNWRTEVKTTFVPYFDPISDKIWS